MPDAEGQRDGPSRGQSAAGRYAQLETERAPYLRRARDCAALTLPNILPPEGTNGDDLPDPYQSVGARGVNNLAAKLLLSLLPPGTSFFRLAVDEMTMEGLVDRVAEETGLDPEVARSEIEKAFSRVERSVVDNMEQKGVRAVVHEGLKHLLVAGNVCREDLKGGGARLHFLPNYVVKRDKASNVLDLIIRESVAKEALPAEVQEWLAQDLSSDDDEGSGKDSEVHIYTWVQRDQKNKQWKIHQEVAGRVVPGSEGTDPLDKPRFHALRLEKVDGEDYGRSYVEAYLGDLRSLEALTQAIVEGSAAAARILLFVDESGFTRAEDVTNAPNGAAVPGRASDVTILQLDKYADFRTAENTAVRIEKRLEQDFLLMSSIQRNAERVTAEEIRTVANELEQSLGGIYSLLAQEFQRPMVVRHMFQMQRDGTLPPMPDDTIEPKIVAGLEGLSRSSELNKIRAMVSILRETFGEQHLVNYINPTVLSNILAAALGISDDGLVRSEDEVRQLQQEAQRAQMEQQMGPEMVRAMSGAAAAQQQQMGE